MIDEKYETGSATQFVADLFLKYRRLMFSTAKQFTSNLSEQEDIVQDVLLKLLQKEEVLRDLSEPVLVCYAVKSIQNTAMNYLKKQSNEQNKTSAWANLEQDISPSETPIEDLLIGKDGKKEFYDIFQSLPEPYQSLLYDKYLLELNDTQIAEKFDCKASSVRMMLTRARRKFLELYKSGGARHE